MARTKEHSAGKMDAHVGPCSAHCIHFLEGPGPQFVFLLFWSVVRLILQNLSEWGASLKSLCLPSCLASSLRGCSSSGSCAFCTGARKRSAQTLRNFEDILTSWESCYETTIAWEPQPENNTALNFLVQILMATLLGLSLSASVPPLYPAVPRDCGAPGSASMGYFHSLSDASFPKASG